MQNNKQDRNTHKISYTRDKYLLALKNLANECIIEIPVIDIFVQYRIIMVTQYLC